MSSDDYGYRNTYGGYGNDSLSKNSYSNVVHSASENNAYDPLKDKHGGKVFKILFQKGKKS